jgi:hypothetical protein
MAESKDIKMSPAMKVGLLLLALPFSCLLGQGFLGWLGDEHRSAPTVVSAPPVPSPVVSPPEPPKRTEIEATFDAMPPSRVEEMSKLIAGAQRDGLFGEIDWKQADVYVGATWQDADIQNKRAMAMVLCLEYVHRYGKEHSINFLDRKTGKRVARFYPRVGLEMD